MIRRCVLLVVVFQLAVLTGCGKAKKQEDREPVFPVTGVVTIDGKPQAKVNLQLYPAASPPGIQVTQTVSESKHGGTTDAEGKFALSTYEAGDGVPAGEYVVAMYWAGENNPHALVITGDDEPKMDRTAQLFNRKYGNPSKSKITVKVEAGGSVDMGTLDLTTK